MPDDEAEDVRSLLKENRIDFYETPPDIWGVSSPAIWLRDEQQLAEAKSLLKAYQAKRCASAREFQAQQEREGKGRTLLTQFREDPVRFIAYCALILAVAYISIKPFLSL